MSSVVWFDLASGASGDMLMAALADAGGPDVEASISRAVASLGDGYDVRFEPAARAGLACRVARVGVPPGRLDVDGLREAVRGAALADRERGRALAALDAIVAAESAVHGAAAGDVHLHDLGSPDTAADLVGVAAGLQALDAGSVGAAPVPVPYGWVRSESGPLPLPAPATLRMLHGVAMRGVDADRELLTPTAAALLVGCGASFGPMPAMVLRAVGTGGGSRDPAVPNVCRALVGTPAEATEGLRLEVDVLLEANIDDQPPESLGPALDALLAAGAKDAWITPIVMKKSRPAFTLSVLVGHAAEPAVLDALFRHTTTLGTRRRETQKWALAREVLQVQVRGTNVRVKVGRLEGAAVRVSPEFDDCAALAARAGVPVMDVYAEAAEKARRAASGD